MFIEQLTKVLSQYHLLKHPFYKKWNDGLLSIECLQDYASQYYQNVEAFPRYVSGVHSNCDDLKSRQILLGNLIDEENGEENHPELWLRFAESLGLSRKQIVGTTVKQHTKELVNGLLQLTKESYASGLGALFAYENQIPDVATSKIAGLKQFYGYKSENPGLKFFTVHIGADQWHSKECADLLDKLDEEDKNIATDAALKSAKLLWSFLDQFDR